MQVPAMQEQLPVTAFSEDGEKNCHRMMMSSSHPLHQHFIEDFVDVEQLDLYQAYSKESKNTHFVFRIDYFWYKLLLLEVMTVRE